MCACVCIQSLPTLRPHELADNEYTRPFSFMLMLVDGDACKNHWGSKDDDDKSGIYIFNFPEIYEYAAAAAKLLQSSLTLCDPTDGRPPGSLVPGILQARTLEWIAISFSSLILHFGILHGSSFWNDSFLPFETMDKKIQS